MKSTGRVIVIEGSIGVGKSTLGRKISNEMSRVDGLVIYIPEPSPQLLLSAYIRDMKKYALTFQLYILSKRGEIYRKARRFADQGYLSIIDRSMAGDAAFATLQHQRGTISDEDFQMYRQIWEEEIKEVQPPDVTFYLKADPATLMQRIQNRGIVDEIQGYNTDYLESLAKAYETAFESPLFSKALGKLIYLDTSEKSPDYLAFQIFAELKL